MVKIYFNGHLTLKINLPTIRMSIIFNQIHHEPDTFFISRKAKYRYNRVACYKYIVSLYFCKMKLQITRILVSLRLVYQRETKTFVISNTGKKLEAMEWIHAVTGPPPPCLPLPPTWRIRLIAEKKSTSTSYQSVWPRSPVRRTRCALYPKLGSRAIQTGRKWHRRNPPSHLFPLLLPARLCQLLCPTRRVSSLWNLVLSFLNSSNERGNILFRGKLENVFSFEKMIIG